MSDYFDHVERELRAAVRSHAHLPWYVRLRLRHSRALVVALAALVVAGPALAAVGLLQSGSQVGAGVPPTPNAYNGVAIRSTVRMLALRVPDPDGRPPWGMRVIRTTRGLLCLQVGRVAFGTVGVLGRDGAFANDGRFHPFSANYETEPGCVVPDAHGNGFFNVQEFGVPASGLFGQGCQAPRSVPAHSSLAVRRASARRLRALARRHPQPVCRAADLRDIYYGLLGPEAVSITYAAANGRLVTTPTTGADGAYLIVLPGQANNRDNDSFTYDARLFPGSVRAVAYRDGHTCRLSAPGTHPFVRVGSCPPVGYASPAERLPSPAEVASPITARVEFAKHYCSNNELFIPCPDKIPPGFRRLDMTRAPAQALVRISFVSRVAVTNGHSYYYIQTRRPPLHNPRYPSDPLCPGAGDFGQTDSDYAAGQRVTQSFFESLSCRGVGRGNVTLVITTGPSAPAPMPAVAGQSVGREVGHFSFTVP